MKIGMISLGCPKNLVDSEVMLGLAQQSGHELTREAESADVLIVNTCAFIDKAKQESIDTILEMAEHKKTGQCTRLVVTGCLAERYRDELKAQIPEIDAVLGTGQVPEIVNAIGPGDSGLGARDGNQLIPLLRANGEAVATDRRVQDHAAYARPSSPRAIGPSDPAPSNPRTLEPSNLPTYLYDATTPRLMATPRHYSYLKIAEGCDYKCAFCIIPTLRGKYRSRDHASVIAEARALAARGTKELLLISQDTSFYGVDRGERGALGRLLRDLNRVDDLEWIRMLYLYPTTITDDVLDAIGESERVCKYIDLPLQHASDSVLKRMKRPGTRASYERLLERIRQRLPGVALRTTFIVGFPGETASDVEALQQFITDVQFDHVGVFTYSHEEGTSGFQLEDDVPAPEKRRRRSALMSLQKRIVSKIQRGRRGQQVRLVVDGPSEDHDLVWRARTEGQAPDIDPVVYLTDVDPSALTAGQFISAELVGSRGYDLVARPLVACEPA
jgi:ribosomal protein S12 methylthiotransferase